jgi:hypothetical protein
MVVFPNPTDQFINLSTAIQDKEAIEVFNLLGQDFSGLVIVQGNQLDVSKLPHGVYVLKLNVGVTVFQKR